MPSIKIADIVIRKSGDDGGWGEGQFLTGNVADFNEPRVVYGHVDEPNGFGTRRRPNNQWSLPALTFKSLNLSGNPDSLGGRRLTMDIYENFTNGDFRKVEVDFTFEEGTGDAWVAGQGGHGRTITISPIKVVKGGKNGKANNVEGTVAYDDMALPVHDGVDGAEMWADTDTDVLITRDRASGAKNIRFGHHILKVSKVIA